MTPERFAEITGLYSRLRLGVLGDFCLDRYLEIDPQRSEISIETGLPVHNIARVRSQPGAAGTILNNLVALGIGTLVPIGFAGEDGEGYELLRALGGLRNVRLDAFLKTPLRRTFAYCKPLIVTPGEPPRELNRLDTKNWTPTPTEVEDALVSALTRELGQLDGLIVMDQVSIADTGVVTRRVLEGVGQLLKMTPTMLVIADSRRSLRGYPPVSCKMNRQELGALLGTLPSTLAEIGSAAATWARQTQRPVFVTLAEDGMIAADPAGATFHTPALPVRGPIDIVGAGDAVTANLMASLAAGASLEEAIELASAAASIVIHQLGTTGTAPVEQLATAVGNLSPKTAPNRV